MIWSHHHRVIHSLKISSLYDFWFQIYGYITIFWPMGTTLAVISLHCTLLFWIPLLNNLLIIKLLLFSTFALLSFANLFFCFFYNLIFLLFAFKSFANLFFAFLFFALLLFAFKFFANLYFAFFFFANLFFAFKVFAL